MRQIVPFLLTSLVFAIGACNKAHESTVDHSNETFDTPDGEVPDLGEQLDIGALRDDGVLPDATWTCPATAPNPWSTPGDPCEHVGQACNFGSGGECGVYQHCECNADHRWACLVAEPDPICHEEETCPDDIQDIVEGSSCTGDVRTCSGNLPSAPGVCGFRSCYCHEGSWSCGSAYPTCTPPDGGIIDMGHWDE